MYFFILVDLVKPRVCLLLSEQLKITNSIYQVGHCLPEVGVVALCQLVVSFLLIQFALLGEFVGLQELLEADAYDCLLFLLEELGVAGGLALWVDVPGHFCDLTVSEHHLLPVGFQHFLVLLLAVLHVLEY